MSTIPAPRPAPWARELEEKIRAGASQQFLLHFNIHDVLPLEGRYAALREYLVWLLRDREAVAFYNRSSGIAFSEHDGERRFRTLAGLDQDEVSEDQQAELQRLNVVLPAPELPRDPARALSLFERAMREAAAQREHVPEDPSGAAPGGLAFVIEYAETIVPSGDLGMASDDDRTALVTLQRWANEPEIVTSGALVIMTTANLVDIHPSLRSAGSRVEAIRMPLPDRDQRYVFIQHTFDPAGTEGPAADTGLTAKELANATAGLTLRTIGGLIREARSAQRRLSFDDVKDRKRRIIDEEFAGMVEIVEPRFGLDALGGLQAVKEYLLEVVTAVRMEDTRMVPMGIILMGPPGTGKTALVEALAYECGFGFAKILNPRERWVGQSERNFWRALMALESLAPVVVLEDEADQSEQSRDEYTGDSGVSNRLRQMRFSFTSDPGIRGRVLWIRITNRPDKLDTADKRSGRGSERIPLLMPDDAEKKLIFAVMPQKHGFDSAVGDYAKVIAVCAPLHGEALSGADIEEISLRAYQHARREGRTIVAERDYLWASEDFITLMDQEAVQMQELLAVTQCSSRRFLPPRYREMAADGRLADEARRLRHQLGRGATVG